ncbi:Sensory box histidine kinase [Pseudomonas savastanoi]|uniref:histidine kinase n=2 Tax=Pseudomonas savastanoi TaxID=29438 RepID=A0A3M5JRM8_PSESS|nr:Sensory box histidine kinase [Pseudomonas savastanoi]RMT25939.1 Sensory box histidine kinase [Pseudomonas savastanoi]
MKKHTSEPCWRPAKHLTRPPRRWVSMRRRFTANVNSTTCERPQMKLAMKLRTRLFLSISALITVALLGLLLGLVSVMQMARTQESLIQHNFAILDLGLKLRQNLGDQLVLMTGANRDQAELERIQSQFEELLEEGSVQDTQQNVRNGFEKTKGDYRQFIDTWKQYGNDARGIRGVPQLSDSFDNLRNGLLAVHRKALENISSAEINSRDRALWIAGLLGLVGLAVLCIGFVTAHGIARRFGAPIEALAKAADRIGEGDYEVTLPISSAAEMNLLTRRFGIMAEALRQHQATNIDELLAGQQRLQAVLDSIDDGLLMIDRQWHLEHLNPVAQRQLGWDESRLGQSLGDALGRPELDEQLHLVLRGGTLERAPEDLAIEIDGESRLLTYSMTPVSHTKGHILGAVMVLHDVTEQRAFERVRSEFVLRASHELRTPVTGMHMAFGLLQERLHFAPETREADLLNTVTEEMQRLMQLINDLLNFSRYQNGLQKLKLAPCSIETLLEEARARFEDKALEQDIVLMLDMQEPMPRLHADQSQLERVLDNLLDNALRHTPQNGLIRLQARRHGERAIISVEDNGEGIAYGQQGRIFEPFVQVGRKKGGAGLGLALCKEIVQLHGGRMGVYSRPGQGTQFYMALPL